MKKYSHDYTRPAATAQLLLVAANLIKSEHYEAAEHAIMKAREELLEYLNQDNMVIDEDVYDGWYSSIEVDYLIDKCKCNLL